MGIFNGHIITNAGKTLLGRVLTGEGKMVFTKCAFGAGKPLVDIKELNELIDKRLDLEIADILNDRGTVALKVQVNNKELQTSFRTEEFGIYAKIEGDAQEVLYAYATAIEPDPIPNGSFQEYLGEHNVYIVVNNEMEAEVHIKDSVIFLTAETANKNYVLINLKARGELGDGRNFLETDAIYKAEDGIWYRNLGGARNWTSGNGKPDNLLKAITYEQIYKDISEIERKIAIKASTSEYGIVKVGEGLEVENGVVKHPNSVGNKHIPVGGSAREFLKWASAGIAKWGALLWSDIDDKPTTFQPAAHTQAATTITEDATHRFTTDTEKTSWNNKENSFVKNTAFNKAFGYGEDNVARGYELARILGVNYTGLTLNNNLVKTEGIAYYCTQTKQIYECYKTTPTTINYADSDYFRTISSKQNSDKLENLFKVLDSGTITNSTYTIHCNYFIFSKFMFISIEGGAKNIPADITINIAGFPTGYNRMISIIGGNRNTNRQLIYDNGILTLRYGSSEIQYNFYGQLITFNNN